MTPIGAALRSWRTEWPSRSSRQPGLTNAEESMGEVWALTRMKTKSQPLNGRPGAGPHSVSETKGQPFPHTLRSSRNSDAGSTLVTSKWSRALVQATYSRWRSVS
jgi:hypothetical protein